MQINDSDPIDPSGVALEVVSVELQEEKRPTFNFEVADYHTYFVGNDGVWVHNVCKDPRDGGTRRKNRIPDKGEPNTVAENPAGTTRKKYGSDGNVQKEWNKGHGPNAPKNEQTDHIHDYKPNPYNPSGRGERMPGREPRPRDLNDMDLL